MNIRTLISSFCREGEKKPVPILSFPSVSLLGINVEKLIGDSSLQAKGLKAVADRTGIPIVTGFMDLSVEAQCFGAEIIATENEVPVVKSGIIKTAEDVYKLPVPDVSAMRAPVYIEGIRQAKKLITDRPVFAQVIGPYSLAGRLTGETEAMLFCFDDPDMMKELLGKCSLFIKNYILEYKKAGADGVLLSEPLAGLLSPDLAEEFSEPFVRDITDCVRDENFAVIYHNCGNACIYMLDSLYRTGADAYHFGNAVDMKEVLEKSPSDKIIMGNLDPVALFRYGSPEKMKEAVYELLDRCSGYPNFVLSSGCDVPPPTPWENTDAFFRAAEEYYSR